MVLAGFIDLDLSQTVVNAASKWAQFGADYGLLPGFVVAVAASGLLLRLMSFSGSTARRITQIAGTLILSGLHFAGSVVIAQTIFGQYELIIGGALALLVPVAFLPLHRQRALLLRPMALAIVLLAIVHPIVIVQLLKILWGRVRFEDLDPGLTAFSSWVVPQGITGNQSFPSGHAAMAWMFLPVAMLFPLTVYRFRLDAAGSAALGIGTVVASAAIWLIVLFWGFFVSASRMVIGAHYLSDVLFSTGLAFGFSYLIARSLRTREL
jgi:membrane-associated phospholipid phosphatase